MSTSKNAMATYAPALSVMALGGMCIGMAFAPFLDKTSTSMGLPLSDGKVHTPIPTAQADSEARAKKMCNSVNVTLGFPFGDEEYDPTNEWHGTDMIKCQNIHTSTFPAMTAHPSLQNLGIIMSYMTTLDGSFIDTIVQPLIKNNIPHVLSVALPFVANVIPLPLPDSNSSVKTQSEYLEWAINTIYKVINTEGDAGISPDFIQSNILQVIENIILSDGIEDIGDLNGLFNKLNSTQSALFGEYTPQATADVYPTFFKGGTYASNALNVNKHGIGPFYDGSVTGTLQPELRHSGTLMLIVGALALISGFLMAFQGNTEPMTAATFVANLVNILGVATLAILTDTTITLCNFFDENGGEVIVPAGTTDRITALALEFAHAADSTTEIHTSVAFETAADYTARPELYVFLVFGYALLLVNVWHWATAKGDPYLFRAFGLQL